jgi:hypothetical protein
MTCECLCQSKAQYPDKRISGNQDPFAHEAQALGNSERAFQGQGSYDGLAQRQKNIHSHLVMAAGTQTARDTHSAAAIAIPHGSSQ